MMGLLKTYGLVFALSMVPVIELRGAIPTGMAMGLNPYMVFFAALIGNMLPVPFIILFIRRIFGWMHRLGGVPEKVAVFMEAKADRAAKLCYKYALLGLFLLVAIPIPGTGAWTGALVAALLQLRFKTAIPAILLGVIAAGLVVTMASCGVISLWSL